MSKKKPPKRVFVVVSASGTTHAVYKKKAEAEGYSAGWFATPATIHAYQLVEPKTRKAKS